MLETQGLLGVAFFEATACVILLVLFVLLRRDHPTRYFGLWLAGWTALTLASCTELYLLNEPSVGAPVLALALRLTAFLFFVGAILNFTGGTRLKTWPIWPFAILLLVAVCYGERRNGQVLGAVNWGTALSISGIALFAGWILWRRSQIGRGHGAKLLAGIFLLYGLNRIDRVYWPQHPLFLLRVSFNHLLEVSLGIAMAVLVLEAARFRTEELNDKLRRLTLLTTASTQTLSVKEVLQSVLAQLVGSMAGSHGLVRLIDHEGKETKLVARAAVGFDETYLAEYGAIPLNDPWAQRALKSENNVMRLEDDPNSAQQKRMMATGVRQIASAALPGKDGPLGIIAVGTASDSAYQADELAYLTNIANLLGLTLQNVKLFEQVDTIQRQWAYTFDSIGDPILVHDRDFRILRTNHRLCQLLGREASVLPGRNVIELFSRKNAIYANCPYCEGISGEGDEHDPWLPGYFLTSNSTFTDPTGRQLGTIHVLKDITERKRAEEKYKTLVSNVQEGVFISTPQGRFLDFNDAFMRIAGYDNREQLMALEIPKLYVSQPDRDRLKRLLNEHGSVSDFEFEMRTKDGESRTVLESSIAVRDTNGTVMAYQGFLLDITERKRAEQEIRRRNRELLVLNSIAQTLSESLDLGDSVHRALRQIVELFNLDATSLYLFDDSGDTLKRLAAVGHRSEYARYFPPTKLQPELMEHIRSVHATFLSVQGLPMPQTFRDVQRKEEIVAAYAVILWSKDRVMGALVLGARSPREFAPADINLLIAVGSQISSAIERTLLYEQTRLAYEDLRRTQEQLLHSEKMAAVGQLISGVAHELNNPLTAILGYSQLLTSSGQLGPQGLEYSDKLYKQAQRTHRIVQNLLSFARQHKPERMPVQLNKAVEDTLALRDYDLRMSNIRVHLDLKQNLPMTAADPHQMQQVFLNIVNNAVDAILEISKDGDLWVKTGIDGPNLYAEFTDSGPGVKDSSRVFDPFYTTKPVGKGTGLGLSICYGIVTEHGGTIRVSNASPRGATFRVVLPCQPVTQSRELPETKAVSSSKEGRVLVYDEDESVLEAVEAILRGGKHRVHSAKSFLEAKKLLQLHEYDLVIGDLEAAAEERGLQLKRWITAERPALAERIVLMRAGAHAGVTANPEWNGAPVLQKPFKGADLLAIVEAMLSRLHTTPV